MIFTIKSKKIIYAIIIVTKKLWSWVKIKFKESCFNELTAWVELSLNKIIYNVETEREKFRKKITLERLNICVSL